MMYIVYITAELYMNGENENGLTYEAHTQDISVTGNMLEEVEEQGIPLMAP